MRIRNQTTVVLTKKAQGVKDDLAPVFGLKNILSAGLILFDELSCSDQKIIILEANSIQPQQEHTQASKTDPAKKVAQNNCCFDKKGTGSEGRFSPLTAKVNSSYSRMLG